MLMRRLRVNRVLPGGHMLHGWSHILRERQRTLSRIAGSSVVAMAAEVGSNQSPLACLESRTACDGAAGADHLLCVLPSMSSTASGVPAESEGK